jgi:hypothetical protein
VGAVAVVVVGVLGVVDEVVAVGEARAGEVRHPDEVAPVLVGDPGVDDRDDHALAAGPLPGLGHVDHPEVPLLRGTPGRWE